MTDQGNRAKLGAQSLRGMRLDFQRAVRDDLGVDGVLVSAIANAVQAVIASLYGSPVEWKEILDVMGGGLRNVDWRGNLPPLDMAVAAEIRARMLSVLIQEFGTDGGEFDLDAVLDSIRSRHKKKK